jgi:hypothetical protein
MCLHVGFQLGLRKRPQDREYRAEPVAARRRLGASISHARKKRVDRSAGGKLREQPTRRVHVRLTLARKPAFFLKLNRKRQLSRDGFDTRE